jgi:hypothetical protein
MASIEGSRTTVKQNLRVWLSQPIEQATTLAQRPKPPLPTYFHHQTSLYYKKDLLKKYGSCSTAVIFLKLQCDFGQSSECASEDESFECRYVWRARQWRVCVPFLNLFPVSFAYL